LDKTSYCIDLLDSIEYYKAPGQFCSSLVPFQHDSHVHGATANSHLLNSIAIATKRSDAPRMSLYDILRAALFSSLIRQEIKACEHQTFPPWPCLVTDTATGKHRYDSLATTHSLYISTQYARPSHRPIDPSRDIHPVLMRSGPMHTERLPSFVVHVSHKPCSTFD
jgi:hypothetical protein